jgi:hypothetical protein
MISHYWWQGVLERGEEAVMIFKTRASLAEKVRTAVKAGHSYTTPSILVLRIEGGDPDYLRWIFAETEEAANSEQRMANSRSIATPRFLSIRYSLFATRRFNNSPYLPSRL